MNLTAALDYLASHARVRIDRFALEAEPELREALQSLPGFDLARWDGRTAGDLWRNQLIRQSLQSVQDSYGVSSLHGGCV